ncbi:sel1 repeat family protein [Legionella sp. 27cVA30]|uniref:tetratricopeptide repeat protein n=1 Tax=Legionella sp. 27cVA30 TaxID=2905657 RepID=UPI0020A05531|nr:tetratricopeptide repeat protein [Legionella sp. 27cVA30]MCP0913544.1 sel1 repeat family protein [Legionella sp. 27cVA30]
MTILNFQCLLNDALNGKEEALNQWNTHTIAHDFTEEEISQALKAFAAVAATDSKKSYALFLKGLWCENGLLEDEDYSETISLYAAAIEFDNTAAMVRRAYMNQEGMGGDVNYAEALRLYDRAIERGNADAMNNRANMHENGLGGDVNYAEALRLYDRAIERGNADAMNNRANMHENGLGGDVNYAEAIRLYEMAIELGNAAAMNNRALMHALAKGGVRDYKAAIQHFDAAIKLGHASAMCNRAHMHQNGLGDEINYAEAIRLYEAAIEHGDVPAILRRAFMHQEGLGGARNYREALSLYEKYEEETGEEADGLQDCRKKIISEFRETNKKLDNLYAQIDKLSQHGKTIGSRKGEMVQVHAQELESMLNAFILTYYKNDTVPSGEEEQLFKAKFIQCLKSKDKEMGEHREAWKPIVNNVLIALTGIGFVALLAKIITHAVTSHLNKTDFSLNKACFFAETRSQRLALEIEQANNWVLCRA